MAGSPGRRHHATLRGQHPPALIRGSTWSWGAILCVTAVCSSPGADTTPVAGPLSPQRPVVQAANLPAGVGGWRLVSPQPEVYDEQTIFDYMNGAGEIYVGYRFRHLEVYRYAWKTEAAGPQDHGSGADTIRSRREPPVAGAGEIVVELYRMSHPDDAWGLLSLDPDGLLVGAKLGLERQQAFYDRGHLRATLGKSYIRLIAEQETTESTEALIVLGRDLAAGQGPAQPPDLVAAVETAAGAGNLTLDPVRYIRSNLPFELVRRIDPDNALGLRRSSEAAAAGVRDDGFQDGASDGLAGTARETRSSTDRLILLARYPDASTADRCLEAFLAARGLSTENPGASDTMSDHRGELPDRGAWSGYRRTDRLVALALHFPDRDESRRLVDRLIGAIIHE